MREGVERCFGCGGMADKDAVGISKKLLGKDISKFFCLSCLAENIGVSVEDLIAKIEECKQEGCELFS